MSNLRKLKLCLSTLMRALLVIEACMMMLTIPPKIRRVSGNLDQGDLLRSTKATNATVAKALSSGSKLTSSMASLARSTLLL